MTEARTDGWVRLSLTGQLDFASAPVFEKKLLALRAQALSVRLDLSQIEFVDSRGLSALIRAVQHSRGSGWRLDVERDVGPFIEDRFRYLDLEKILGWQSRAHD